MERNVPPQRLSQDVTIWLAYTSRTASILPVLVFQVWLVQDVAVLEAAVWIVLGSIAVFLMRRGRLLPWFRQGLRTGWWMLPFVAFSALSTLWSVSWEMSLSRWLVLVATIAVAGVVGLRYDGSRLLRLLGAFSALVLLASVIVVLFAPDVGIMNYHIIQGAWKGIFWHKNHMGLVAAFATIMFLVNAIESSQARARSVWMWGILYVASFLVVVQAASAAAYLTLVAMHALVLLALTHMKVKDRLQGRHYAAIAAVLAVGVIMVFLNADHILRAVNRNSTLTGRVPMWGHLFDKYLSERPIAGYGFNAFWSVAEHRVTMQRLAGYPDPIVIADNGFIDILMNTGYVGLGLFLAFYIGMWWLSLQRAWRARNITDQFPLFLMAYSLLANATWSLLFENESLFMLIMLSVLFWMSKPATTEATAA